MRWPFFLANAVVRPGDQAWPVPLRLVVPAADGASLELVLALQWEAILGRDLVRQARRRARERGATHWSHAGGRAEVVGMTRLEPSSRSGWRTLCAAAQCFARLAGPGVHLAFLSLPRPDAGWWLVVVRDGQVLTGGDQILADPPACERAARLWQERFGDSLSLWGECVVETSADVRALSWSGLAAHAGPAAMLQTARNRLAPAGAPGWRLVSGLLAPLALVLWLGWGWLAPNPPAPVPLATSVSPLGPEVWHEALARWYRQTSLPTWQTMQQLALEVLQVPVTIQGWQLRRVSCERTVEAYWRCRAEYRRAVPTARQAGLTAYLPSAWHLHWRGLDDFDAAWTFHGTERNPQPADLHAAPDQWLADADRLQRWRPAWQRLEIGLASPVAIQPQVPAGQQVPPEPPGWQPPTRRSLLLHGPLRSLSVLDESLTRRIAWHSLDIQFGKEPRPGLTRSALMLTLQGTLYENATPALAPA